MYNRYVPQSDGSFRRSRMPDAVTPPPPAPCPADPPCKESSPPVPPEPPRRVSPPAKPRPVHPRPPRPEPCGGSAATFLRKLLPRDFDTGDLLVVLLLLLMGGDCAEDQNTALLTLALYLFL